MSMSTHVVGFRPPDEKWQKMKAIWDACVAAKVPVPNEVHEFFNGEPPDPAGVRVELEDDRYVEPTTTVNKGGFSVPAQPRPQLKKKLGAVKEWRDDMREGFEVDVTKLPKDVTIVRFYNSY